MVLTIQGLPQCCNGRTGTVWSYISVSAGWLQFSALWPACNVYCYVRTAGWRSSLEELGLHRRNWLFLVSAYLYALLRGAFFWRYIYIADVFDHNVHVMEKHANWNLTHVKVRCCCSLKKRHIWILDRLVPMNVWDFNLIMYEGLFWMAPTVGLRPVTELQVFHPHTINQRGILRCAVEPRWKSASASVGQATKHWRNQHERRCKWASGGSSEQQGGFSWHGGGDEVYCGKRKTALREKIFFLKKQSKLC